VRLIDAIEAWGLERRASLPDSELQRLGTFWSAIADAPAGGRPVAFLTDKDVDDIVSLFAWTDKAEVLDLLDDVREWYFDHRPVADEPPGVPTSDVASTGTASALLADTTGEGSAAPTARSLLPQPGSLPGTGGSPAVDPGAPAARAATGDGLGPSWFDAGPDAPQPGTAPGDAAAASPLFDPRHDSIPGVPEQMPEPTITGPGDGEFPPAWDDPFHPDNDRNRPSARSGTNAEQGDPAGNTPPTHAPDPQESDPQESDPGVVTPIDAVRRARDAASNAPDPTAVPIETPRAPGSGDPLPTAASAAQAPAEERPPAAVSFLPTAAATVAAEHSVQPATPAQQPVATAPSAISQPAPSDALAPAPTPPHVSHPATATPTPTTGDDGELPGSTVGPADLVASAAALTGSTTPDHPAVEPNAFSLASAPDMAPNAEWDDEPLFAPRGDGSPEDLPGMRGKASRSGGSDATSKDGRESGGDIRLFQLGALLLFAIVLLGVVIAIGFDGTGESAGDRVSTELAVESAGVADTATGTLAGIGSRSGNDPEPTPRATTTPEAAAGGTAEPAAATEVEPTLVPLESLPPRRAVLRNDGRLYLEGPLPDSEWINTVVGMANAVLGADRVENNYVIHPEAPVPETGTIVIEQDIDFATNETTIQPEFEPILELGASLLNLNPRITMLIEGHTDSEGDPAYNRTLSLGRAMSIVEWLVVRGGIDTARLEARGYGDEEPIADNATEEGRALNRRIEVTIFGILDG